MAGPMAVYRSASMDTLAPGGGRRKPKAPPVAWNDVICARHYCVACKLPESRVYGHAMVHCIRCPASYHRKCAIEADLETLTTRTFLCQRCVSNTPKGLNAPDPMMPPHVRPSLKGAAAAAVACLPDLDESADGGLSLADCFVKVCPPRPLRLAAAAVSSRTIQMLSTTIPTVL